MKNSSSRWLGLLLIGACGVAGYAAGSARNPAGKSTSDRQIAIPRAERTLSRERRPEEDVADNFKILLSGSSRETDIWRVVSRLPVADIPDALRKLREAQAVTSSRSSDARWLDEIESALYFHWAESDPMAALADVSSIPKSNDMLARMKRSSLIKSVLAAWMRTDANAAYGAVKDHEEIGYIGRDMLVRTWNPGNVFENLKLFPDKHRDLLGWYCVAAADDPFRRDAMLAALKEQPDMKDRDWANFMLFRSWGYKDFTAAVEEAMARKLPNTVKQLLTDNLPMNPEPAMRWAVSNGIPPGGPLWEKGYSEWLGVDGPGARQWLTEQAPVWEENGHRAALAGLLAQGFANAQTMKFTTEQETAAKQLSELMERWKSKDPEAAAKWLDTASLAARKLLAEKGTGDHE